MPTPVAEESGGPAAALVGPSGAPVVVVLGGISATCRFAGDDGWWRTQVGPCLAVDTGRWRVLGLDWAEEHDQSGTAAQADALADALDRLGIPRVHAVVGASFGGMVALQFGARHPTRAGRLVVLCAAHEPHPMVTALRSVQRRMLELGIETGRERDAVALARSLAMTTYRTEAEFTGRFAAGAEVESWLRHAGERFAAGTTAARYLALSRALDQHAVDPSCVRVPVHLLAVEGDAIAPPWQVRALHARLPYPAGLTTIASRYGHDAFLKEHEHVSTFLRQALTFHTTDGVPVVASRPSATVAVRAGIESDLHHGAVVPPLHLSANFAFTNLGQKREHDYTRTSNPTRRHLARALADLEGGAGAEVTCTGMAAVTLVLQRVRPGERVVAPHDCYGGTRRALLALAERGAFELTFADLSDPVMAGPALARPARLAWVETPSNPLLRITDIARVAGLAHAAGAEVVVDNTFLSPALQRPIALGADLVLHSTTKYINGHSDVVGGAVVARDPAVAGELAWWANALGLGGSPFDSWLTLRGLRTLHARLRAHQENAKRVAELLTGHPAVAAVHFPGLPAHPGHALARQQQEGFGAIVSFELRGGQPAASRFVDGLVHFSLAESLGGVESLVAHPATMTHASMTAEAREAAGIADGLLRLSVGIEDAGDLVDDLEAGLGRAL